MRVLVLKCASPLNSEYPERVAKRFSDSADGINIAASKYAVDLAKSLNLLNDNLVWTNLGHLLKLVADDSKSATTLHLNQEEKLLFLRLFLDFDGAAIIFFSKKMERQGQIPLLDEGWVDVSQELFLRVYEEYLTFLTDPQVRTKIRHLLEKRRYKPFRGQSGPHQSLIHINTMYRLGLVDKHSGNKSRLYTRIAAETTEHIPTSDLIRVIPDIRSLEALSKAQDWYRVAGRILDAPSGNAKMSESDFVDHVQGIYERIVRAGVSLCSLQTIFEAIQIKAVLSGVIPFSFQEGISILRSYQGKTSSSVRFHVDRYGRPAFIKM